MLGKLACGFVGIISIIIALNWNEYWPILRGTSCHTGFHTPHHYLATKTPYLPHSYKVGDEESTCQAVQLWMVVRHGTRNPSAKVIEQMARHLPILRDQIIASHKLNKGSLCLDAVEALTRWTLPPLSSIDEKKLVNQGEIELHGIATRFRKRFPSLITTPYSNSSYKFKYTKTQRAAESAKFFTEGLFGAEDASLVQYPEALHADPILRFYKGCARWKKEVKKTAETYIERKRFETTPIFQGMLKKLNTRLGLEETNAISVEIVEVIYMTCAFETAWTPSNHSPWCHLFDQEDLEVMQYRQDLEYYWVDGYGFPLTYTQACPAVQDLLNHLKEKVNEPDNNPSLIAYFTHSGTTLKLLARFGLFNETAPLLHDNYHVHKNRKWKTSHIDKFATNLAFVLYNCSNEYHVGLLFNEENVSIPGCGSNTKNGLCTLEDFKSQYDPIVNNCDMAKMCQLD